MKCTQVVAAVVAVPDRAGVKPLVTEASVATVELSPSSDVLTTHVPIAVRIH